MKKALSILAMGIIFLFFVSFVTAQEIRGERGEPSSIDSYSQLFSKSWYISIPSILIFFGLIFLVFFKRELPTILHFLIGPVIVFVGVLSTLLLRFSFFYLILSFISFLIAGYILFKINENKSVGYSILNFIIYTIIIFVVYFLSLMFHSTIMSNAEMLGDIGGLAYLSFAFYGGIFILVINLVSLIIRIIKNKKSAYIISNSKKRF